jgi:hypothetical protein
MIHLYLYLPTEDGALRNSILARVKALKPSLGTNDLIQPQRAVPGSPGPVLAWKQPPHFITEYALINEHTSDAGLVAALRHVLRLESHPNAVTDEQMLSRIFGAPVRLIEEVRA